MTLFSRLFGRAAGHHRRPAPGVPRLEALEDRTVLTGNVTTTSFGFGSLRLTGDGEANAVRISRDPAVLSRVVVQALPGTKLNGVDNGSAVFLLNRIGARLDIGLNDGDDVLQFDTDGLTLRLPIRVDLGGGVNTLDVQRLDLLNTLTVFGGDVRDDLTLNNLNLAGLVVHTGGGDDHVFLGDGRVSGNAFIDTGRGGDTVQMIPQSEASLRGLRVNGELRVDTGLGHQDLGEDVVDLARARLEIGGPTTVLTGGGRDLVRVAGPGPGRGAILRDLKIDTAAGDDQVLISSLAGRDLTLDVGRGNNAVGIGDRDLGGQDSTFLGPVLFAGRTHLTVDQGANVITLRRVTFLSSFQFRGPRFVDELVPPSSNALSIQATTFGGDARFDTGVGRDRIDIQRPDDSGLEAGSTLFFGRVVFDLGRGDDTVDIGHHADATHLVSFGRRVTFDGGLGTDLIHGFSPTGAIVYAGGRVQISCAVLDAFA